MLVFFQKNITVYAVETGHRFNADEQVKLEWLFSNAKIVADSQIEGVLSGRDGR